jgi:hypothetical protein
MPVYTTKYLLIIMEMILPCSKNVFLFWDFMWKIKFE